jgi:hypothetical protein
MLDEKVQKQRLAEGRNGSGHKRSDRSGYYAKKGIDSMKI